MLPNSIERTAPILGYDPYAFIMGKKSNFSAAHPITGGGLDYFAKNPENMYTNGEKAKKKTSIRSIIKGILGTGAVIIGAATIIAGAGKIKTTPAVVKDAAEGGKLSKAGGKIMGGLKSAGDFIKGKLNSVSSFIKGKFHKS